MSVLPIGNLVGQTFLSDPCEQAGMPVLPTGMMVCQTFLSDIEMKRLKMKIPKAKAIELINKKIKQFENILKEATYENRYNEDYDLAYSGTEMLITELFSEKEMKMFKVNIEEPFDEVDYDYVEPEEVVEIYKEKIGICITQLKAYRERIENFWPADDVKTTSKISILPFVSMSFEEMDKDINEYVTGILKALKVDFETGERYYKDSIPEKVQGRIRSCDLFVTIFVRRDKLEAGGYSTPGWLLKELGIAQGAGKDIIAWVEQGIKDIAGLNWEKEVIYFVRDDVKEMEKATIKFLEALKEHKLI
jgi:uncharacterized Zn finger protein (UPF0148 family)